MTSIIVVVVVVVVVVVPIVPIFLFCRLKVGPIEFQGLPADYL
jgi:hypothetical protein